MSEDKDRHLSEPREEVDRNENRNYKETDALDAELHGLDMFLRTTPSPLEGGGKVRYNDSSFFDEIESAGRR